MSKPKSVERRAITGESRPPAEAYAKTRLDLKQAPWSGNTTSVIADAKLLAAMRVDVALKYLKQAQGLLDEAANQLAPISGTVRPQWYRLVKLAAAANVALHMLDRVYRDGHYGLDEKEANSRSGWVTRLLGGTVWQLTDRPARKGKKAR